MQKPRYSPPQRQKVKGYGIKNENGDIETFNFTRRPLGKRDVQIKLLFCGVCHSDVHHAYNEWRDSIYPQVPGHEMTGIVEKVGEDVEYFEEGDKVAIGNLVNSCRKCEQCGKGNEQYCLNGGPSWVYNGHERNELGNGEFELFPIGELTMGGYSEMIIVNEDFVLKFPDNLDMASGTPLLCAGITMYNPLIQNNVKEGMKIGIVGIGGLGHLGIKMAKAMGAYVVGITHTEDKIEDILGDLGADAAIYSQDFHAIKQNQATLDLILDTIPHPHPLDPYLNLLKVDGKLWILGVLQPENIHNLQPTQLPFTPKFDNPVNLKMVTNFNRAICGSNVGGIDLTQEMLNFCGENEITADIELINIKDIHNAFDKVKTSEVRYRYVIDLSTL